MIKKILTFLFIASFSLVFTAPSSTRSICEELAKITTPEKWDAPFLVKTSARLVDGVTGPLVELTHENAPLLTSLVKATCTRLKIPFPALYVNLQKNWDNMSQGSLTPTLAYIVVGKDFIEHHAIDDAEIMRTFLHECGHNVYSHNVKLSAATLVLFALWLTWITQSDTDISTKALSTIPFGAGLLTFFMAYARFNEYMADRYEADTCENPQHALELFESRLARIPKEKKQSFLETLSYYFLENHPPCKDRLKAQIARLKDRQSKEA